MTSASVHKTADAMLASKGRTFHWARHLLGGTHAARATRLYGFCRWIDDLADESVTKDSARAALDKAMADIQARKSNLPQVIDALQLMDECSIDSAIALELICGITGDLETVCIQTQAELLQYCYRVAGTVGLMMSAVLDVTDEAALPHAIDLGIGMQLTNICRDVREDALNGRRYLPSDLVGNLGVAKLVAPSSELRAQVCAGVSTLLDLADIYYKSGEDGLAYLPARARAGILVASRVYHGIGVKIRNQQYDYWTNRTVVSTLQKAQISAFALGQTPLIRNFWTPAGRHDVALHIALAGLPKVNSSALARSNKHEVICAE